METVYVKYFSFRNVFKKATLGSSGFDLHSMETVVLCPRKPTLVGTGISIELPLGYEGQIRPRSGLALKGVTIVNSPGTIDSDYRGEIRVILLNLSDVEVKINEDDRIAQLIISEVPRVILHRVSDLFDLSGTERGSGGFGSTGK